MKQSDSLKLRIPFVAEYNNLGEQYIVSAKVHMDESTPHMHIVFIPVIHKLDKKSGKEIDKIACSEYWKGKDSYKKLQDKFYEFMTKNGFNLERGKETGVEHLSTKKLKQITEYERIKEEIDVVPIQEIESENFELIVVQNKQLMKYNRKLKKYLIKSLRVIEDIEILKEKVKILSEENNYLKNENKKLKDYIKTIFEVTKQIFKIPVNSMKQIISEFIKEQNENKMKLSNKWENSKRVFTNSYGGSMHPDTPSQILEKIIKKYDLKRISFHGLRHTSISLQISSGIQAQIISKRAGHSSVSTTHNIYSHFFDNEFKEVANKMDNILKVV